MFKQYARDLKDSEYKRKQLRAAIFFGIGVIIFTIVAGLLFKQSPERPPAGRMEIASDFPDGVWFNTAEPISLFMELKGHVIVILFNDFNTLSDLEDLNRLCDLDSTFSDQPIACVIVSVGNSPAATDSLVEQWQIEFPVLADPEWEAMNCFSVSALPAVLVIDTASRVSSRYYEDWHLVPLEALLQDLLEQGISTRSLSGTRYQPVTGSFSDNRTEPSNGGSDD